MTVIPGKLISVPTRFGSRWLRSMEALNLLFLDEEINRNTYWTLYKLVSVRFRSSIEYYRVLSQVHARDVHCQSCASGHRLEMDHKKQLILYPRHGLLKSNLRLLCFTCHERKSHRERTRNFYSLLSKAYGR